MSSPSNKYDAVYHLDVRGYPGGYTYFKTLDIFFFNREDRDRLDAYTHLEQPGGSAVQASSRTGEKTIFVVANSPYGRYDWVRVHALSSLESLHFRLADEDPQLPVMTGESYGNLQKGSAIEMELEPLLARIRLRTLAFELQDSPLGRFRMENVKCYLTYANSTCPARQGSYDGERIYLNPGQYREEDVAALRNPGMLYHEITGPVGYAGRQLQLDFFTYPNELETDGAARHFTRLVIQGDIGGTTYYYPLALAFPVESELSTIPPVDNSGSPRLRGISGGREYVVDVFIRQFGSLDPGRALSPGQVRCRWEVRAWKEQEHEIIEF